MAEAKFGSHDSLARLVYFKIIRFGRTRASNAARPGTGPGPRPGPSRGPVDPEYPAAATAAAAAAGPGPAPPVGAAGSELQPELALLRATFDQYRGPEGGVQLPAFVQLCTDLGLVPSVLTVGQVGLTSI